MWNCKLFQSLKENQNSECLFVELEIIHPVTLFYRLLTYDIFKKTNSDTNSDSKIWKVGCLFFILSNFVLQYSGCEKLVSFISIQSICIPEVHETRNW